MKKMNVIVKCFTLTLFNAVLRKPPLANKRSANGVIYFNGTIKFRAVYNRKET